MKRAVKLFVVGLLLAAMLVPSFTLAKEFSDVEDDKWYSNAVGYVTDKGYFAGTSETTFEPHTTVTRAMFVTVLAAHSGADLSDLSADQFSDVAADTWYDAPIGWAYENNIVSGISESLFAPFSPVTRQEVCVMLSKYIKYSGYTIHGSFVTPSNDDESISSWAVDSVYEIKSYGIVTGKQGNMIDPVGIATRAEVAQIIMKLDSVVEINKNLDVDVVDIKIEGLTEEFKLLHISDTHVTLTDSDDPQSAVEYQQAREALFASEITDGVSSTDRFNRYFKLAESINANMVAMTGDIIDAPTSGNLSQFKNTLESSPVDHIYALGNHDWTAEWLNSSLGGYQSQQQREQHLPLFNGIIAQGEAEVAIREFEGFKIIAVDNSNNQISANQLQVLYEHLDGEGNDKPVILLMHVPLFIDSMINDVVGMWGNAILMGSPSLNPTLQTQMFCQLLADENSPVVAILAGHVHMDHVDDVSVRNDTVQYTLGASYKGCARIFNIHG